MQTETQDERMDADARSRIGKAGPEQAVAWPHMRQSELVERFNSLGPEKLVKVLVFERSGDATSRAEGVWVLIADGDQDAGIGVLLSNVVSLDGCRPQRGDLVEYRTINVQHKPYVVAWVDGSGD